MNISLTPECVELVRSACAKAIREEYARIEQEDLSRRGANHRPFLKPLERAVAEAISERC